MGTSYAQVAKKIQTAINLKSGAKLVINTQQWYSDDRHRVVTCYVIKQTVITDNDEKPHRTTIELFRTYSTIQMVLWLRDYWYELNGWEIPKDNEMWEAIKNGKANKG